MEDATEKKERKFKVGDRVHFISRDYGTIIKISQSKTEKYPIEVKWDKTNAVSTFTKDGYLWNCHTDNAPQLTVVDRRMDALDKKTDDAINPAHYKVKGLPEAHEIMNHLMHREQLEGFYWGNIIKYAYRYGRKGDKEETAGKIAWYAQKLQELGECESK